MGREQDRGRGIELVLATLERANSLLEFLTTTGLALEEHLGYRESAFMLTLADVQRAYAGVTHGSPEYVIEEYFERWADRDVLASQVATHAYMTRGWTSVSDVYTSLDEPHRRYVDTFLRRIRCPHQLSVRIPGGASEGYLTVMGNEGFTATDRAALEQLVPALAKELRSRLPTGLQTSGGLPRRERQVCELIALGFTNREIGEILHVEEDTVKKHTSRALARFHMRTRTDLAVAWTTGRRFDLATTATA